MKSRWMPWFAGAAMLAASTLASAHGNVSFGVYLGAPAPVYAPPVYAPAPVYYPPPPVYYPPRVYYGPAYYGPVYRYDYGPPHRDWHRRPHGRRW